jgi:transcriptional pleiotropic regulator of transition state genes
MKATGIVRRVDELGRIVLPMEIRRTLGINPGAPIEIFTTSEGIVLKPYSSRCGVCGNLEDVKKLAKGNICERCISEIIGG